MFLGYLYLEVLGREEREGKITCIKFARENKIPFGICFGMQMAVIDLQGIF